MSLIENQVIQKINDRADMGKKKYGVTMERDDLNEIQWLIHAQEEALDLAIYLQRIINQKYEVIE